MNANDKSAKKEEIISRAVQILTKNLTETNGIQKIKEIVCNNNGNDGDDNRASTTKIGKSNKIFNIIFSSESVNALLQNMKLTGTAKSGIEIFKASKSISSFFSRKTTKTKTTMRRKTTRMTTRSRSSDPMVSQVDIYFKAESIPIIEHAIEPLKKSCLSANFINVVQSQCIEPIIKRVANRNGVESYFNGGGSFQKVAAASLHACQTRSRNRSRTRSRTRSRS